MARDIPSVHPSDDARTAIDLLSKSDLGAIPVVDNDNKLVGIVSESDLILSEEESDLHLPHYLNIMGGIVFVGSMKGFEKRLDKAFATKVSELMTADPIVARSDDPFAQEMVIKKPFKLVELAAAVERALHGRQGGEPSPWNVTPIRKPSRNR